MSLCNLNLMLGRKRKVEVLSASPQHYFQNSKIRKTDYEQWKANSLQPYSEMGSQSQRSNTSPFNLREDEKSTNTSFSKGKSLAQLLAVNQDLSEDRHSLNTNHPLYGRYQEFLYDETPVLDKRTGTTHEDSDVFDQDADSVDENSDIIDGEGRKFSESVEPDSKTLWKDRPPSLRSRLQEFLPAIAAANWELESDEGKGKMRVAVEIVEEDESEKDDDGEKVKGDQEEKSDVRRPYVEMSLGLGVMEEKGGGKEEGNEQGEGGIEMKGEEEEKDALGVLTNGRKKRRAGIEVLGSGKG